MLLRLEKTLDKISTFLNVLRLVLCPKTWSGLEEVARVLEKNVCSAAFAWRVLYRPVTSIWPGVSVKPWSPCWLSGLSTDVSGCESPRRSLHCCHFLPFGLLMIALYILMLLYQAFLAVCGLQSPGAQYSRCTALVAAWCAGSAQTRDWNCLPCLAGEILNQILNRGPREVPPVMSSWWAVPFIIIRSPSLSLVTVLPWSLLSDMSVATHSLFWLCSRFHVPSLPAEPVCLQSWAELSLRRQRIVGFCFLTHLGTLCHFISEFNPFIFKVIIGKWGLRTAIFVLWLCSLSTGASWWLSGKEPACPCRSHKRRGFDPWVRKISWNPLQYSCLENPTDRQAAVQRVADQKAT